MKRIGNSLQAKARKVVLLLLDVDGVLTDGGIYIDDRGVESKRFDVRDGQGITLLQRAGIPVAFMTARSSNIVRIRARELGIKMVFQGVRDKAKTYEAIKQKAGLRDDQIAYMGDDIGDLSVLRRAGLAVTVADCWSALKPIADYVTRAPGGRGAVREVVELLLRSRKALAKLTKPSAQSQKTHRQ